MDAKLKADWIAALRSGEYLQTVGFLEEEGRHCCLGVLCKIQGADFNEIERKFGTLSLSENPAEYLGGLIFGQSERLANMNDNGSSFAEIADWIERNVPEDGELTP